jgi:hypothetical protein
MNQRKRDPERKERITLEIIVDGYDEIEQAVGWYDYLQDKLQFPFTAECVAQRAISPLQRNETVEVIAMALEEDCEHEICPDPPGKRSAGRPPRAVDASGRR